MAWSDDGIRTVPSRVPGSMAGEIWIAPDFDTLPEDIAEAFGMTVETETRDELDC